MIEFTNFNFNRSLCLEQNQTIWEPVHPEWINGILEKRVLLKIKINENWKDIEFSIKDFYEQLEDYLGYSLIDFGGLFLSEETAVAYIHNEIPSKCKFGFNFHKDDAHRVENALHSFFSFFMSQQGIKWEIEDFGPFFESLKMSSGINGLLKYHLGTIELCARNFQDGPHIYSLSPVDSFQISLKRQQMRCVIEQYCAANKEKIERAKDLVIQRHYRASEEALDTPLSNDLMIQLVEVWGRGYTLDDAQIKLARLNYLISFFDLKNTLYRFLLFKIPLERVIFLLNSLTFLEDHLEQTEEFAKAWPKNLEESPLVEAIANFPNHTQHYLIIIKGVFFAQYAGNLKEMGRGFLTIKDSSESLYLRICNGDSLHHPAMIALDWIEKIKKAELLLKSCLDVLKPILETLGFAEKFPDQLYFKRLGMEFCRICEKIEPHQLKLEEVHKAKLQRYIHEHGLKDYSPTYASETKKDEMCEETNGSEKLPARVQTKIDKAIEQVKKTHFLKEGGSVLNKTVTFLKDLSIAPLAFKKLLQKLSDLKAESSFEALCYVFLKGITYHKLDKSDQLRFALMALSKATETSNTARCIEILDVVARDIKKEAWRDFYPYLNNIHKKVLKSKNLQEIEKFEKFIQLLDLIDPKEKLRLRIELVNSIAYTHDYKVVLFKLNVLIELLQKRVITVEVVDLCARSFYEVSSDLFESCRESILSLANLVLLPENVANYSYAQKKLLLQSIWFSSQPCLSMIAEEAMNRILTKEEILVLFRDWHEEQCLTERSQKWLYSNYRTLEMEKPIQKGIAYQFFDLFLCLGTPEDFEAAAYIWKQHLNLNSIHAIPFLQGLQKFVILDLFGEPLAKVLLDITAPVLDKLNRKDSSIEQLYKVYVELLNQLISFRKGDRHYIAYCFPIVECLVKKCPSEEKIKHVLNDFLVRYGFSCFNLKYYPSLLCVAQYATNLGPLHRDHFMKEIRTFLEKLSQDKRLPSHVAPTFEEDVLRKVSYLNETMEAHIHLYPKLLRKEIKTLIGCVEQGWIKKYSSVIRLVIAAWECNLYTKGDCETEIALLKANISKDVRCLVLRLAESGVQEDERNLLGILPIYMCRINWTIEEELVTQLAQFLFLLPLKRRNYDLFSAFFDQLVAAISVGFFKNEEVIKNLYFKLILYPAIFVKLNEEMRRRHNKVNPFTLDRVNDFINNAIKEWAIVRLLHEHHQAGRFGKLTEEELKELIARLIVDLKHLTAAERLSLLEHPPSLNEKIWGKALALTIPLFERMLQRETAFALLHEERMRLVTILKVQVNESSLQSSSVNRAIANHKAIFYKIIIGEDDNNNFT